MSTRTSLSREIVLRTAVELADIEGIDAVSMRNVAARLSVVPMALYKHVANKEDLLNGMVDVIVESFGPPSTSPWREAVRERILSARTVLLAHPWARGVIETRTTRTPTILAYMDSLAGMFIAGGMTPGLTHLAMHTLGHRIWGFSPEAFDGPNPIPVPEVENERALKVEQVRQVYPHIVAIFEAAGGNCDEQAEFEFTLDLLLDAFERMKGEKA